MKKAGEGVKRPNRKRKNVTMTLSDEARQMGDTLAARRGIKFAQLVEQLIRIAQAFNRWLIRRGAPGGVARVVARHYFLLRESDSSLSDADILFQIAMARYRFAFDSKHRAFMAGYLVDDEGRPRDVGMQSLCNAIIATENRWGSEPELPSDEISQVIREELFRAGIPAQTINGRWPVHPLNEHYASR